MDQNLKDKTFTNIYSPFFMSTPSNRISFEPNFVKLISNAAWRIINAMKKLATLPNLALYIGEHDRSTLMCNDDLVQTEYMT